MLIRKPYDVIFVDYDRMKDIYDYQVYHEETGKYFVGMVDEDDQVLDFIEFFSNEGKHPCIMMGLSYERIF